MPLQTFGTLKANFWLVMNAMRQGKIKKHHFKILRAFAADIDTAVRKDCATNASKASHAMDMWDKFSRLQNKLSVPVILTSPLVRKTLQEQIAAINKLKNPTHVNVNMKADIFTEMVKILKALTDPAFINALENDPGFPKLMKILAKFSPIDFGIDEAFRDMLRDLASVDTGMHTAAMDFPEDPEATDPKQQASDAIVYLMGKESAKVSVRRGKTIITATDLNFNKSISRNAFMRAVHEKIVATAEHTLMHTAGKISQYEGNSPLQLQHTMSKRLLFKQGARSASPRFEIKNNPANGKHSIINRTDNREVIKLKVTESAANEVERVELIDTGKYNDIDGFSVSGLIIAELGVMAKELGATSVTISSTRRDGSVNVNNVLRAAFTALHKDLLPKFDDATWQAIQEHLNTRAVAYLPGSAVAGGDKFTAMFTSGDFASFLLQCRITGHQTVESDILRSEFTELLVRLGYQHEYTALRSKI